MAVLETDKTSSPYKLSHSIFMNVEILGVFLLLFCFVVFFLLLKYSSLTHTSCPSDPYTTTRDSHFRKSKLPSLYFHLYMKLWKEKE